MIRAGLQLGHCPFAPDQSPLRDELHLFLSFLDRDAGLLDGTLREVVPLVDGENLARAVGLDLHDPEGINIIRAPLADNIPAMI